MQKSSFKPGNANAPTHQPIKPSDAGAGQSLGPFKDQDAGLSDEELWATASNPVKEGALPAKGLRSVGG